MQDLEIYCHPAKFRYLPPIFSLDLLKYNRSVGSILGITLCYKTINTILTVSLYHSMKHQCSPG